MSNHSQVTTQFQIIGHKPNSWTNSLQMTKRSHDNGAHRKRSKIQIAFAATESSQYNENKYKKYDKY